METSTQTQDLAAELLQFTGTEHWWGHPLRRTMTFTDGVKHFMERAEAYWFGDIVATELMDLQQQDSEEFLHITMTVKAGSALINVTDGNDRHLWEKRIDWTDCPEGEWVFYLIDGVLLLPSEY